MYDSMYGPFSALKKCSKVKMVHNLTNMIIFSETGMLLVYEITESLAHKLPVTDSWAGCNITYRYCYFVSNFNVPVTLL